MIGVLVLGVVLSLDNARTAVVLGARRLGRRRSLQVALSFGLCDALAPGAGILAGHYAGRAIASQADYAAATALGAYGVYLVVRSRRTDEAPEADPRWILFGLPLALSLDNVVAGASVGLLGFSPWLAPPIFGATTAVMSLAGLQLGRAAAGLIRIRADLLAGATLVALAVSVGLGGG